MKRREFLNLGLSMSAGLLAAKSLASAKAWGADKKAGGAKITDKDILKQGEPAPIANYCEHAEKQPNKFCPDWKAKPGHCRDCMFFNKDNSLTTYKGAKYARCQLLADPKKAQFVSEHGYCSTYVKKA